MATSYKMRMYRRRAFQHRYLIGIISWLAIAGIIITIGMIL